MPYLKSNISNNMIKYSIESDYIDFSIEVLENENDFFKLIKFFLTKLKQDNCSLPIKFYTNDYLKNEDLDFLLEETNKENFRFCLTISQNNILKFFKQNLLKVLKNNYDVHLYHSIFLGLWSGTDAIATSAWPTDHGCFVSHCWRSFGSHTARLPD